MSNHPKGPMGLTYSEEIQFDAQGRGAVERTVPSVGIKVDIRGWISGPDAVYDILLESPESYTWKGVRAEEEIHGEIRLKWGSTRIKATITSNQPNTTATFHLTA